MDYVYLKSKAKINLTLDVLDRMDNGYHDIQMVVQSINLHDSVYIKKTKISEIKIASNLKWLPVDNRNLAYKACEIIIKNYNLNSGVYIELFKRIPICAGLGGGSSNCATVLIGLRKLFNLSISNYELVEIGKEIGADVPFCVMRGTMLAEGIGEKLTRLPPCPFCYVLLAKPSINVSTGTIYNSLDLESIKNRPNTDAMIDAIAVFDIRKVADNLCNVLETVTIKMYPVIDDIKKIMYKFGALGAIMSGSGPTVFGLFLDKKAAVSAMYYLKLHDIVRESFVTTIFNYTAKGGGVTDEYIRNRR